ncbi:MAG: HNH endonuclease [Candidatus Rokubacteria bacterium]|nr:HNH endonuclease [Candidatus Rokubacteria bacterium]
MARKQHAHSRKRGVAAIPLEGQKMLIEEFDGKCAYCGNPATTWDHVVPVIRGGRTTPSNVVPACSSCNSSKKNRDVLEWLEAIGRTPSGRFFDRLILAECGLGRS